MKRFALWMLALLVVGLSCSCSMVRTLDSESGLYDVKLQRHPKAYVDGGWTWGKGNPYAQAKEGSIYIAPLDISKVVKDYPDMAPLMVDQMHRYVVDSVSRALSETNKANHTHWKLTDQPQKATLRVDMAVVHFRPQRPVLKVASSVGGHFVKVPGVSNAVGYFASGDICIEMTVRDGASGQLYLAFKDSNPKSAGLLSAEAYKRSGNADAGLHYWAERLAFLVRLGGHDKLGDHTLLEYLDNRSWGEVMKQRIMN